MKTPRQIWRLLRRNAFEACGSAKYSRPSFNALDRKFEKLIDFDNGFFIEVGAADGFEQSNTYYLERWRNWSGVLVEPIPQLFRACCKLRKRSKIFNAALVSSSRGDNSVLMNFAGTMSSVENVQEQFTSEQTQTESVGQRAGKKYDIRVPARTLTSVLDEAGAPAQIDFFSLDVEGFEPEVLRGLDFSKYRPRYICIEVRNIAEVEAVIATNYRRLAELSDYGSYKDVLYESL